MSYKLLNDIFYKDLSDLIINYIMIDKAKVKYNNHCARVQFLGRWQICSRYLRHYGVKTDMTARMYFDHCEEMGFRMGFDWFK